MITKSYNVSCDECTRKEQLISQTIKDCEDEAKNMKWVQKKPHWYCPECIQRMDHEARAAENA